MSFESELRNRLQREANSVQLPGRDPASAANRSTSLRRRRQLGAAAMVAVCATAVVAAPLLLANNEGQEEDAFTNGGTPTGLPATGPIDFDFQSNPQGLLWPTSFFQDSDDGTVYALSTAPGPEDGAGTRTPAMYRLSDDGQWEPVLLSDLNAYDLAGTDGMLYAVSTAPSDNGAAAFLSTSADGGENWVSEEVATPEPPSDAVSWTSEATMTIETSGSNTLALVTHAFALNEEELFEELRGPDADRYMVTTDERGLTLTEFSMEAMDPGDVTSSGGSGEAPPPATTPPVANPDEAPAEALAEAEGAARAGADPEIFEAEGTEIRTIPWSDLGVGGPDDLVVRQLFRRAGESWEPVETDLSGLNGAAMGRAAGKFTLTGWREEDGLQSTLLVSDDGSQWSPVEAPGNGVVYGIGDVLIQVPTRDTQGLEEAATVLQVSADGGATWSEVDLGPVLEPGEIVYSADGGPLGLGLAVGPAGTEDDFGGPQRVLFSGDLVDWTSIDVAEETGIADISEVDVLVGEDRVVYLVNTYHMSTTATLVGTPTR